MLDTTHMKFFLHNMHITWPRKLLNTSNEDNSTNAPQSPIICRVNHRHNRKLLQQNRVGQSRNPKMSACHHCKK